MDSFERQVILSRHAPKATEHDVVARLKEGQGIKESHLAPSTL